MYPLKKTDNFASFDIIKDPQQDFTKRKNYGNFESNLLFLKELDILNKDCRILEIGTGKGNLLNHLFQQGYNIEGIEVNEESIKESRRLHGALPIKRMSGDRLDYEDTSFDIVMSFDVLEHIKDTDKHLKEVSRVLKPNGHYLLQTPNKWTNTIFETIRWKSFTKWREDHCSLHNYWEIIKRFQKHNFDVFFHKIPVVTDFFKVKMQTYMGKTGLMLLNILNPDKLPMPLRTNFYIKAKKYNIFSFMIYNMLLYGTL